MQNPSHEKIAKLREKLNPGLFSEFSDRYKSEPRGQFKASEGILLVPDTTRDVAEIITHCNTLKIPVIPYGGGTGLVGGQIYNGPEIPVVISLHKLNRIRDVSVTDNLITVEAGCILQRIQEHVAQSNLLFPLSIASKGSCQIGGNLATNAGGVHVIRYGNTRDLCLGLEVVLPDGSIMNNLHRLYKDNLGLDLRNLMIGSEGILGIITAATMKIFPKPVEEATAYLSVPDLDSAIKLLQFFRENFGGLISAFELISETSFHFVKKTGLVSKLPFEKPPKWSVLVDLGSNFAIDLDERLLEVSSRALSKDLILDGVFANSEKQRQDFWNLRELIPEANRRIGSIATNDISVPISRVPKFVEMADAEIAKLGGLTANCFGHIGDGNIHYNVFGLSKESYDNPELKSKIREIIFSIVNSLGGSYSAEHGTGRLRIDELKRSKDKSYLSMIGKIKRIMDPNNIMNPGVLVSQDMYPII